MSLSQREVDIEIVGQNVAFDVYSNESEFEAYSSDLADLAITDCIRSLRRYTRSRTGKQRPKVDLGIELVDSEKNFWDQTIFGIYVTGRRSHCDLQFVANASVGMQYDEVLNIISSQIEGTDFPFSELHHDKEFLLIESDGWRGWTIDLTLPITSKTTFGQLFRLRSRIGQEVFLPSESLTTPFLILRAIQSGRIDALLGKPESEVLDVKSMAYDLKNVDESRWKPELAQDVAQFANASTGGLLLLGYRTKRIDGLDIIQKITPVQHKDSRLQAYGDVLKSRIHPPISGLQIGSVPAGENEIIYIYVPPQPEESRPYIISGALIDDHYVSTGISIVRRQGDSCIPVKAEEIHAALVIGRALIRGGRSNEDSDARPS
jgi:hypothetical protein